MSALNDIQRDIDRMMVRVDAENGKPVAPAAKRWARAHRMRVVVGKSAERSILAATGDARLPEAIDDVPVVRTEAFDGFEVVVL